MTKEKIQSYLLT